MSNKKIVEIDIETFSEPLINCDLVIYEKGKDPLETGLVLYGYDEIYDFSDDFKYPSYCIIYN